MEYNFEWDDHRNRSNYLKHGIDFETAQYVFMDKRRLIVYDDKHSEQEKRWFCVGSVDDKIITVRFTYRENRIRIFGAGEWKKLYER